jgi:hypothetical protein
VKRKIYTSRGQKEGDFFGGYFVMAAIVILVPVVGGAVAGAMDVTGGGLIVLVAAVGFLIVTGIYRPWMAVGALGCLGSLIALGLLAAVFLSVVCSSAFGR